jgi:N-methylhydantoinase A
MVDRINSKPVYTVHELWEGSEVRPRHLMVLGGPATQFAEQLMTQFDGSVSVVPHHGVANAIGCALARTTSEITLFADTARQLAVASGELFSGEIPEQLHLGRCPELALQLLREKALRAGPTPTTWNWRWWMPTSST